ncbi:MAG: hypothetical protein ACOZNI_15055 [Myxococcota bacterium]
MRIEHLGQSGVRLAWGGASLAIDPPARVGDPVVVTWTEAERVAGARAGSRPVAASPEVLRWLGIDGVPLDGEADVAGFRVRATPYDPIPYATAPEAVRKTMSALRSPRLAFTRLSHTLRRPAAPPLALDITRDGVRVVFLGQALHRFVEHDALDRLVRRHAEPDVLVAGTDFDDEEATGRLMRVFGARRYVLVDAVGPIRRMLGLPVRSLQVCLAHAPRGTIPLEEHDAVDLSDVHPKAGG